MATFRIEKNKNYTVMSNYHLRDKNLSLKTKGLLSIMLSLPEDWDYSEAGLAIITGEGRSSIQKCLHELEVNNYLTRSQTRVNGRLSKMEYVIYEVPLTDLPSADLPSAEKQSTVNPSAVKLSTEDPLTEKPSAENQSADFSSTEIQQQLNKDLLNTNKQNTCSINPSISQQEQEPVSRTQNDGLMDRQISDPEKYETYKRIIKDNIGYDMFERQMSRLDQKLDNDEISIDEYELCSREYNLKTVNSLIGYMLDILISSDNGSINISGNEIPKSVVRSKLLKIDFVAFKNVVKKLSNSSNIKNPKAYAISMLYNES